MSGVGGAAVKPERFTRETRLLASTRQDGHQAQALDTKNVFEYVTGTGWIQLVLANGVPGRPIVVADTSKTLTSDASDGVLLPPVGEPGQTLTVDPVTEIPAYLTHETGGNITIPVDFSDGASHTILSTTIPGSALGAHGFARVTVLAQVVTNASRTATFHTALTLDPSMDTGVSMGTGFQWGIEYELLFINRSETVQTVKQKVITTRWSLGGTQSTLEDISQIISAAVQDTTADWVISADVTASAAITGTAEVDGVLVEYGYVA